MTASGRTVLICDAAGNPALATARSLGRAGWRVIVPAGNRVSSSRWAAGTVQLESPIRGPARFTDQIASTVEREGIDLLASCEDSSLTALWRSSDRLGHVPTLGPDPALGMALLDKAWLFEAAQRHGFAVPAWRIPTRLDEVGEIAEEVGLPCVVKPRRSFSEVGAGLVQGRHRVAADPAEAQAMAAEDLERFGEMPIVQRFVRGRALSVGVVMSDEGPVRLAARETLSFHPIAGGTSVWKRTVAPDTPGVARAIALLVALGYTGLGEVEFQLDAQGRPWLMEIGPRAFGWVELAVRAGADLPAAAASLAIGGRPTTSLKYRSGVEMRWPQGEILRIREATRRDAQLPHGWTRANAVRSAWPPWRPGMRYDGLSLRDPVPSLPASLRSVVQHRQRS